MRDLPLEIGQVNGIVIDDGDAADTRAGEIERDRAAEATGADDQRACVQQATLTINRYGIQQQVSGIPKELLIVHPVGTYCALISRALSVLLSTTGCPFR